MYPQANETPRYKKWAHQPIYNKNKDEHHPPLRVPLSHHHHLPQAVVDHPQDPPAPEAGIHSSSLQALLLTALWPAMVAAPPHTAPGSSLPAYASTCPQAHPATPSPDNGVCLQNPLQSPPEERVMALHQGHRTNASSLPSRALLVTPRHPPIDVSLHAAISPSLDESTLSASPPRAHEVPHLHMQKTTTTDSIIIYIIWTAISQNNIHQNMHNNTKHTSMVKILPWR
jgi:hypothetical protein